MSAAARGGRVGGGRHHPAAAGGVHVDHPRAGRDRRRDGAGDGVRDVVELQIEEHAIAAFGERAHDRRAFGGEELLADLEPADRAAQRVGQRRALRPPSRHRARRAADSRVHFLARRRVDRADEIGRRARRWWRRM